MEGISPTSAPMATLGHELQLDAAWLSGVFDGEGSLSLRKNPRGIGYSIRLEIFNTDASLLSKASRVITALGVKNSSGATLKIKHNKLAKKAGNRVCVTQNESCVKLLSHMSHHLTAKSDFAKFIVAFYGPRMHGASWSAEDAKVIQQARRKFMPRSHMR
jgi:hypothetical protein